jgi:hypothetical protein
LKAGLTVGQFDMAPRWVVCRCGVATLGQTHGGRKGVALGGLAGLHRSTGWLGRLGQMPWKEFLRNLNWILDFEKALENCTSRFRRNFDVGFFLNYR